MLYFFPLWCMYVIVIFARIVWFVHQSLNMKTVSEFRSPCGRIFENLNVNYTECIWRSSYKIILLAHETFMLSSPVNLRSAVCRWHAWLKCLCFYPVYRPQVSQWWTECSHTVPQWWVPDKLWPDLVFTVPCRQWVFQPHHSKPLFGGSILRCWFCQLHYLCFRWENNVEITRFCFYGELEIRGWSRVFWYSGTPQFKTSSSLRSCFFQIFCS